MNTGQDVVKHAHKHPFRYFSHEVPPRNARVLATADGEYTKTNEMSRFRRTAARRDFNHEFKERETWRFLKCRRIAAEWSCVQIGAEERDQLCRSTEFRDCELNQWVHCSCIEVNAPLCLSWALAMV